MRDTFTTEPSPADLEPFGLAPPVSVARLGRQGVNNALFLVQAGGGALVLKRYRPRHGLASLRYEHRLLAGLARAGLPFATPTPVAARGGETLVRLAGGWASLAPFFDAEPLDPASLEHAGWLGAALAELHRALARLPGGPRPGRPLFAAPFGYPPRPYPPLELAPHHLGLAGDAYAGELLAWWRGEAAELAAFAAGPAAALPRQICHNDPAPANVLAGPRGVAAVLDFEFACPAPRALDLAMALRMMMRAWESPDPWPAAAALLDAYAARAPLTAAEARSLPDLIRLRSAIPVLWRLGRMEGPDDAQAVLRGVSFLRNASRWMAVHGPRLAALAVGYAAG